MHVRIAWEIYNHQQKQKSESKGSSSSSSTGPAKATAASNGTPSSSSAASASTSSLSSSSSHPAGVKAASKSADHHSKPTPTSVPSTTRALPAGAAAPGLPTAPPPPPVGAVPHPDLLRGAAPPTHSLFSPGAAGLPPRPGADPLNPFGLPRPPYPSLFGPSPLGKDCRKTRSR